ncbi:hypothetical protein [Enterocloster sp.]|uniref:hypothetical protein n=1 Tax=Enterocloster sp. TaxID=2719315 RepID=UPI0038907631
MTNVRKLWTFADGMFTVPEGRFVVKGESACGIVLLEKEAYNSSIGTRMGGGRI